MLPCYATPWVDLTSGPPREVRTCHMQRVTRGETSLNTTFSIYESLLTSHAELSCCECLAIGFVHVDAAAPSQPNSQVNTVRLGRTPEGDIHDLGSTLSMLCACDLHVIMFIPSPACMGCTAASQLHILQTFLCSFALYQVRNIVSCLVLQVLPAEE